MHHCFKSVLTASAYISTPHTSLWASGSIDVRLLYWFESALTSMPDDSEELEVSES